MVLVSASEQTQCALDSEWVTVALHKAFWTSTKVVYVRRCLVAKWLVPGETAAILVHILWMSYNHALHQFTVLSEATYVRGMCV